MNKQITLNPEEVDLIKEEMFRAKSRHDTNLRGRIYPNQEDKEKEIKIFRIAEAILKKLETK